MGKRMAIGGAAVLAVLLTVVGGAAPAGAATGLAVRDGRLVTPAGEPVVLRGVNHPHAWYQHQTRAFADIEGVGANAVRVVLASGQRWPATSEDEVADVVGRCRAQRLVCVLEVHDTTGSGEQEGAATLDQAVDWWTSVQGALEGTESFVIVNIGNEPHGNTGYESWAADTTAAIGRLRAAGFDHTLMVDGPNWGQDWTGTMRDAAPAVFQADPDRNTVFSIHMYGVYDTAAEVDAYLGSFVERGLPIVVGEFGHQHSDGDPDEDAILAAAERLDVGWLAWSWSGNGGGVEYLDLVEDFDPARLSSWGRRIVEGPNGLRATAEEIPVFGATPPLPPAEPEPEPSEPEPEPSEPEPEPSEPEPSEPQPEPAAGSFWERLRVLFARFFSR